MSQTIANGLETNWKRGDVYCQGQPLFHVAAFGAYCTLILGGTLVVVDSFELAELILTINENKVTRIGLTPQIVQMFSRLEGKEKRSIKSLDTIVYSGSSMSREILVEAHRRLACNLYGLYGMTEIASIACILHPDEHREIINAPAQQPVPVGRATVGTRIWINDTHGDGVGELFVKNDGVMVGYANEGRCERLLSDGWYATGDIGYRDEEGLYYLVSRKNNMIISGGENIYPLEIENCIRSIGPSVSDVIVIGIPSEVWGEAVHAVVESPAGAGLTQDEVKRYCRKNLSPYKKPKEVWIWDKLPRTANGKVDRVKTLEAILAVNEGASVETRQECEEVRRR